MDAIRSTSNPLLKRVRSVVRGKERRVLALEGDRLVDEARKQVGVEDGPTNAHSFRHAFARDILQEGGSLTEVRDQLGHKDVQVTQMYSCWAVGERHRLHAAHSVVGREARRRERA